MAFFSQIALQEMLQFLVSLNPSKHQLQRAILAPKWNRKVSLGAGWADGLCAGALRPQRSCRCSPFLKPLPHGFQRSPRQVTPRHFITALQVMTPIYSLVCVYIVTWPRSPHTQPVISNFTKLSQTHLATKSYVTWTQLVAEFTRIDMKQSIILFIPSSVGIIFAETHPDFIDRVLPQTSLRAWPNIQQKQS